MMVDDDELPILYHIPDTIRLTERVISLMIDSPSFLPFRILPIRTKRGGIMTTAHSKNILIGRILTRKQISNPLGNWSGWCITRN